MAIWEDISTWGRARNSGALANRPGPRFRRRTVQKLADFGAAAGGAVPPKSFGGSGDPDFRFPAATRMGESRASRRRVYRRRRLALRRPRPEKGSGTPRSGRDARRQGFGGDLLAKRPISDRQADPRLSKNQPGRLILGRQADRGLTHNGEIRDSREDSATLRRWVSQRCRRLFRREFRPKTGSRIRRPGRGGRCQSAHTSAHTSAGVGPGGDLPTHPPMSRRPTGLRVAPRSFGKSENRILRFRRPEVARKIGKSGFRDPHCFE